ncbi:MAG TPA: vitamin K epoxide reductase family protein [Candidatus Limnocylindria bacterium]|nr:vitamin K epoxide reductase family protein [Candidatus Limnocylindria bacterium]
MRRPKGHGGATRAPEAPRQDWLVLGLAAAGFVLSLYLTITKVAGANALFCESGGGCEAVQASRYALFIGIPTAAWGMALYAFIGLLAYLGLPQRRWLWAFGLAVSGAAFAGYLTYLELVVIRALCGYCLVAAAIAVALPVVLVARRPGRGSRHAITRPRRLATIGVVVAVATIAFGIAGHMADTAGIASPYQEGLARHLAATGAVFYGAYW